MKQQFLGLILMLAVGCGGPLDAEGEHSMLEAEPVGKVEQAVYCQACPGNMVAYRGQNGFQLECSCLSSETSSGDVWGTDTYTDDSRLCRTALHAGAITSSGGVIVATVEPGQSSYVGSTRNGVTSTSYGTFAGSYSVTGGSSCTPLPPNCPANLTAYRGQNGTVVTCNCSSVATSVGYVWGTAVYTDDSYVCRAAVHAGAISSTGGVISAVISVGLSSYTGSTYNGVTSSSYGAWPGSYSFQ